MDGNENAVEKRSVESKEETQNETKKTEESLPNKSKQCDTTQSTNTVSGEGKDRSRGFIVPHHPTEDIVVARRSTPWFMAFEKNQDAIEKPINTLSTQSFKDLSKEGTHGSCKSVDLEKINQNGGIIIPNSEHKLEELDLSNPEQQTSNESVENLKTSQNGEQESNNHTSTEIRKPTAWCTPTDQNKSNKNGGAKTIIGIQKPEDTTSNESYNCGQELDEQDQIESDDDEKDLNVILRAYKEAKKLYFAKEQRFMDTFANWNFPTNVASRDDLKNMQNKYDTLMEQYTALQAYNVELEAFAAKSIDHLRLWSRDKENAEMHLLVAEKEITKFYKWRQRMARNKKNRQERLIEKESMKQRIQTIETEKTVDTNADVSKSNVILSKRYQSTPAAFNRLNNFLIPEKEVSAPCTLPMERSNDDKDIGCNTGTESQHCKPTQDKTYDEEQQAYRMDAYNPVEGTLDRTTPSQKEVTQFQVVCHMPTEGEGDVVESRPCFQEHPGESAVVKGEVQASHNKGDIAEKESQIRSPNNDVCDLSRECHLQPTHGVQGSVRIKDGVQISQSDMILMQTRKSGMEKDGACSQTDQEEIAETESRPDVRLDERRNADFKDGVTDEEGNKPGGLSSGKNISEEDNADDTCVRITTAEEKLIEDGYDSPFESSDEEETSDDERKSHVQADDRGTVEVKDGSKTTNVEGSFEIKSEIETSDKEISEEDNACRRITTAEEKLIEDGYDSPFESSDEEDTSDDESAIGTSEEEDPKSQAQTADEEEEDKAETRVPTGGSQYQYDTFESSDDEESSGDDSLDDSRHVYSSSSSDTIEAAHGHSTSTSSRSSVNSFCSEEKTESSEESHGGSERSFSSGISASSRRSVSVVSYSDTFESYSDESEVSQSDFSQSEVAKSVSQLSAIKNVESEVLQPKPPLNPRTETQYKRPTGFFKGLIPTPPRPSTEPSKFRGGSSTQNSPYTRPTPFISKVPVPARPKTAHPHGTNLLFSQTKSETCCDDYGAKQLLTQTGSKNRRSDSNLSLAQTESKNCCDDVAVQKTSQAVPRSRLPQLVRSKTPNLSNQKSLPKRPATEPNKYRGKPTRPGSRYSQTKALKPLLQQAQENFAKRSSSECKMLKTGKLPKLNSKAIGTPVKKKLTKKHPKESAVKVPNIRNEKPSKKDIGKSGKSPSRLPQRVGVKKLITPTFEPGFHKLLPKIKVTLVEKSRPSKNDFISRKPGSMSMIPIPKNSPRKPRGESKRNQ